MADRPVYARAWSVIKGPPSQYSFYLRPVFGIFFWELQICRAHKYQAPQFNTAVSFGISKISTAPLSLSHLAFSSSSSPSRCSGRGSVSAIPRAVFCGCRRLASGGSHIRRRRLVRSFFLVYQIDGWRTSSDPPLPLPLSLVVPGFVWSLFFLFIWGRRRLFVVLLEPVSDLLVRTCLSRQVCPSWVVLYMRARVPVG